MVLAYVYFELFKALLDAFEGRLKPNEALEERYRAYPDLEIEKRFLDAF